GFPAGGLRSGAGDPRAHRGVKRSIVVAVARNGVIGRDNALPWRLPADLAHFKKVTMGHPIVMGRRTYESIGKPLPGRKNIVVTHNRDYQAPGCTVVTSLDEVWVIGGTTLFAETLPIADVINLTEVEAAVEGDTFMPPFERSQWREREV